MSKLNELFSSIINKVNDQIEDLAKEFLKDENIKDLNIVHLGSLMLSEKTGVKFAKSVVKKVKMPNI